MTEGRGEGVTSRRLAHQISDSYNCLLPKTASSQDHSYLRQVTVHLTFALGNFLILANNSYLCKFYIWVKIFTQSAIVITIPDVSIVSFALLHLKFTMTLLESFIKEY